ncbi:flagellar basal body protein [Sphingomonas sp.]|uniref:flagellar basal body protein n=1 Tax=Sphingomonas sp. TaxID=28214 RepID=UPI001B15A312|nr:flagellar basal body protein [Sphingomonas sp.]MBO9713491.1 flagellar biosynthesis protein FlgB [Sphingomonas sp.]
MDQLPLMNGIALRMRNLADRQRVIAQNIANSETPGYKARDMAEPSFAGMVNGAGGSGKVAAPQVVLTDRMKALGARQPLVGGSVILDKDITETKPDGNNVTIEDQLLKMGQVQADFTAMTSLYRKQMNLLKTAVGKGGN